MSLKTAGQLRAARALLNWSQVQVAEAASVSLATIKRLEPRDGLLKIRLETLERIQAAFEQAGVRFSDGDAPGVTLGQRRKG